MLNILKLRQNKDMFKELKSSFISGRYVSLQKAAAKPKKGKEVEKAKPEEKAEDAPAENGEAKAEEEVSVVIVRNLVVAKANLHSNVVLDTELCLRALQAPATDAAEEKDEEAE